MPKADFSGEPWRLALIMAAAKWANDVQAMADTGKLSVAEAEQAPIWLRRFGVFIEDFVQEPL